MSVEEVDTYLAALDEPARSTLEALRASILAVIPHAEQGIAYGMPVFRVGGKAIAGFAAFKKHVSYFPHSGTVLEAVSDRITDYDRNKGTLRFAPDHRLPEEIVAALIASRLDEVGLGSES